MEALSRHIKDGSRYDHLFPVAYGNTETVKRFANVDDTVAYIPKVVASTLDHTKGIAGLLKGTDTYETCKNIWHFIYQHINYKKDKEGFEQIRSPARSWRDRQAGVDCDCYSVFISSVLSNLNIPHTLRITKYHRDYFQHIYPIVPHGKGYITIDCVTDKFNYEVPYSDKQDYPMDLQFLNGFDDPALYGDANELYLMGMDEEMEELGKLFAKPKPGAPKTSVFSKIKQVLAQKKAQAPPADPLAPPKKKKKGFFKKVLNVVNKINPATVLLRNGLLAAMKLNVKNVAKRLRWSYLTEAQAVAKGVDVAKYRKLLATRQKLENIFYGAGGKEDNLKKAILKGKGNKDKAVNGLGYLPMEGVEDLNINTPLSKLLGDDLYKSENVEGMGGFQGFGELGEPITLATVGAAMGVISGIVAALKQIGDIFKNKQEPGSADFDEALTEAPENSVPPAATQAAAKAMVATSASLPVTSSANYAAGNDYASESYSDAPVTAEENYGVPATSSDNTPAGNGDPTKENFWDKNKKWIKPVAIGVGGLTLIAVGVTLLKSKKQPHPTGKGHALSGLPRKKKKKNHKRKKHQHKTAIALI